MRRGDLAISPSERLAFTALEGSERIGLLFSFKKAACLSNTARVQISTLYRATRQCPETLMGTHSFAAHPFFGDSTEHERTKKSGYEL